MQDRVALADFKGSCMRGSKPGQVHDQTSWYKPKSSSKLSIGKPIKTRLQRQTECDIRIGVGSKNGPFLDPVVV